jgi:hypothetical protein
MKSEQDGQPVRPHGANGVDDFEAEARSIVETAAVFVAPRVAQGRQELVNEVAVRGVNLGDVEAGLASAGGRLAKRVDHGGDGCGAEG